MSLHMLGAVPLAPSGGTVVSVTVNPQTPSVEMGKTQQFSAVATDAQGNAFAPPVVSWTVVGSGVIDPSGLFTPTAPGTATVTARVGSVTGQTVATVTSTAPTRSTKARSLDDAESEEYPEAETKDDLQFPRQGFPSFRASPMEIDAQPRVFHSMMDHYPDMYDLEHRPWGVNAPEDAAFDWAGIPTDEVGGHGGFYGGGHHGGGLHGGGPWNWGPDWGPYFYNPLASNPIEIDDEIGRGGGGGHGGGGHGGHGGGRRGGWGGGWGPGWGWGGPWVDVPYEIVDDVDADIDADVIADIVAEKVAQRVTALPAAAVPALHMLGAGGLPTLSSLQPYFLTSYPADGEQLASLYDAYLRKFDEFTDSIRSVWHPIATSAVWATLQGARKAIAEFWVAGGVKAVVAVQMLAGIMGWFNANYVDESGEIRWDALNQPVNAGVIEGAQTAAQATVDAAKTAGQVAGNLLQKGEDAISTAWWTTALLVLGGIIVVGLLGWKLLGSETGRAVVAKYLPGK